MRPAGRLIVRTIRAVALLATDRRLPRPLRWLVVVGAMPIPGPIDEALLLVAAGPLFLFYRPLMREAWRRAAEPRVAPKAG